MAFIKTADSDLLNVIKTQSGVDNKLIRCSKCLGWHTESDKCPADEKDQENKK